MSSPPSILLPNPKLTNSSRNQGSASRQVLNSAGIKVLPAGRFLIQQESRFLSEAKGSYTFGGCRVYGWIEG
jgi:hypothetical protein